jgi:hypothetical protein
VKIKRDQKVLRAGTETDAIDRALDLAISEHQKNRLAVQANESFVTSGVYGSLVAVVDLHTPGGRKTSARS